MLNILDLFSGIGGFHKGLLQAGAKIGYCGFSEIDKYAISVYKKHFNESEDLGNVRTITADKLPKRVNLLCGGFPCQAFSIAGKRRGFEDTRGTLFYEIARICEQVRPSTLFLENVKGLLNHDKGRTFETIIGVLGDLGYSVQWQVCNSRYFGVPQNRERVFIVGHYGRGSFRKVFPIREGYGKNIKQNKNELIEITKNMPDSQRIYDSEGISKTLSALGGGQGANTGLYRVHSLQPRQPKSTCKTKGGTGPLSKADGTVYCQYPGNTQCVETLAVPLKFLDRNQKNYQGDYSFTVDTCNSGGVMKNKRIRRLTPVECERLQGYPDNWTKLGHDGAEMSDAQRYKMCGNSVTVNVIETIARNIIV